LPPEEKAITLLFNCVADFKTVNVSIVLPEMLVVTTKVLESTVFGSRYPFTTDVVNSIFNSIECLKGKRGNVYNIANGKYVTIKDLANTMILVSGKNIGVKYFPPKKGDIRHSQTSINLAKMDLGYNPTYSLKKGIEELFRKLKII